MTDRSGDKPPTHFNLPPEVETLLLKAITLPPDARADYLVQATDDPAIRARVAELLQAHARADANFKSLGSGVQKAVLALDDELPFSHAGPWRLIRLLGRGGMSSVHLVERDDNEFEQVAAIKLLPPGPVIESLVRRFRAERSILARLDHPNLARLLDGGVTEQGLPYLVMEYVDGIPIDDYCDQNRLSIDERLTLFEQVLEVAQYAHRNLVVHRDLKPSNILVTGHGQVKLLDFGIAKVLDEELGTGNATELTRLSGRPMTPAWSSPEQIEGDAITTASDVYSLGVLLYRLLAGQVPFSGGSPASIRQAVLTQTPTAPSRMIGNDLQVANRRSTRPEPLVRRLRGDLDTIALMCLRKDPHNRYATVAELADDLRRHQHKRPVRARAGRWRYRAGRFLHRHQVAVGLVTSVALLAGLAGAWHVDRLAAERDRAAQAAELAQAAATEAEREAAKARLVADFMVGLFRQADPVVQPDQELTALDLLERGRARIDQLDASSELRAQMSWTFARVHETRADYPLAIELYEQALDLLSESDQSVREELLTELAMAHYHYGTLETAEQRVRQALAIAPEARSFQQGVNLNMLGNILRDSGRGDEAESAYREAIAIHQAVDPETQEASTAWINLGVLMGGRRHFEPAREAFEHALSIRQKVLGPDHPWTSIPQANLAFILLQLDEHEQALHLYEQALEQRRKSLGDRHPRVAAMHSQLGHVHLGLDDTDQAAAHFELAHGIHAELLAPGHRSISVAKIGLAEARLRQGRVAEAQVWAVDALGELDQSSDQLGLDHAAAYDVLGRIALAEGAADAALSWHQRSLALRQELLGTYDDRRWRAKLSLAETYLEIGDREQAERLLEASKQALAQAPDRFARLHVRLDELRQRND